MENSDQLSHAVVRLVYDTFSVPMLGLDGKGVLVYANPSAITALRLPGDWLGAPLTQWLPAFSLSDAEAHTDVKGERCWCYAPHQNSGNQKREDLLTFLNEAAGELAKARVTAEALKQLSRLIVPRFAAWFAVDILRDGRLDQLVLAHEDPEKVRWAESYRAAYPTDLSSDRGTARVLNTGEPLFVPHVTRDMLDAAITDPRQRRAIDEIGLRSVITAPLFGREHISGVITFISKDRDYDQADLQFAQSLASHIGLALENARLNEGLQRTSERLSTALSSGLVGTWILYVKRRWLYADENLSRLFDIPYTPEGCPQEHFRARLHPEDRELIDSQRADSIGQAEQYETEYRIVVGGQIRWCFARGRTQKDDQGHPVRFTGVVVDITERKLAEEQVRESEELFRFLSDAIPHKLWTADPLGNANYYNQGWYDYLGAESIEELRVLAWDAIHPEDRPEAEVAWPAAISSGEETTIESRLRNKDGKYRWHLSRFLPQRDRKGRIGLWIGTSTDIHELKLIQQALESNEAQFKALAELNSLPIWQLNADGECVFVNQAWRSYTGAAFAQPSDSDWAKHIHPDDRRQAVYDFNHCFAQRTAIHLKYRFFIRRADSTVGCLIMPSPYLIPVFMVLSAR